MLAKLLELDRPVIVYDLETTSSVKKLARIVELAMEVHRPDGKVDEYTTLINPGVPIPEASSKIHGITDEMILTACAKCKRLRTEHPLEDCPEAKFIPTFAHIAPRLYTGFSTSCLAGYNVRNFDNEVIVEEFKRCEFTLDLRTVPVIDGFRLWQILESRHLSDALEHFVGRRLEGAHRAMNDVRAATAVIAAQLQRGQSELQWSRKATELHEMQFPRNPNWIDEDGKFIYIDGVVCFNFGQNNGKPVKTNLGMLRWMLKNQFSDNTKMHAQAMLDGQMPLPPPTEATVDPAEAI